MKKDKKVEKKEDIVVQEKNKRPLLSKLIIVLLFISLIYIYARFIGTKGLVVREYSIINENIPESFDGFSIVQFSDLEYNSTFSLDDFEKLVDKVNSLKPDLVVFTGDLIKGKYDFSDNEWKRLVELLKKIDPQIGKYAVKGDDDYNDRFNEIMSSSDFTDITNSYDLIYYKGLVPIVLYGLGSMNAYDQNVDATFTYPSEDEDTTYMATYRILLAHEPDSVKDIGDYNISLMLSGHSHNSEVNLPYVKNLYNIAGAREYPDKEYKINNTELYVSSGLGTSKFKVRLFDKPSISIFRLYTD